MLLDAYIILVLISLGLSIISFFKPIPVHIITLLISIALLIVHYGK